MFNLGETGLHSCLNTTLYSTRKGEGHFPTGICCNMLRKRQVMGTGEEIIVFMESHRLKTCLLFHCSEGTCGSHLSKSCYNLWPFHHKAVLQIMNMINSGARKGVIHVFWHTSVGSFQQLLSDEFCSWSKYLSVLLIYLTGMFWSGFQISGNFISTWNNPVCVCSESFRCFPMSR